MWLMLIQNTAIGIGTGGQGSHGRRFYNFSIGITFSMQSVLLLSLCGPHTWILSYTSEHSHKQRRVHVAIVREVIIKSFMRKDYACGICDMLQLSVRLCLHYMGTYLNKTGTIPNFEGRMYLHNCIFSMLCTYLCYSSYFMIIAST